MAARATPAVGVEAVAVVSTPPAAAPEPVLTFDERYKETLQWVEKRRRGIDLAYMPWDEIRQLILIRVSQQYHLFRPDEGPYKNWVNRVITNAIRNIWRDEIGSVSRPCITGKGWCAFNCGGDLCSKTPSGLQCAECPAFRDWEIRKKDHHAVKMPVSLENHTNEAQSKVGASVDIAEMKPALDARMKQKLTRTEWRAYRLLYIKNLDGEEVARQMGFRKKRGSTSKMHAGYQQLLEWRHHFEKVATQILLTEDLA